VPVIEAGVQVSALLAGWAIGWIALVAVAAIYATLVVIRTLLAP
jgi:hypothetical protein